MSPALAEHILQHAGFHGIMRYSNPPLTPMNCPVIERAFGVQR